MNLQFDKKLNALAESERRTRQVALFLRSPQSLHRVEVSDYRTNARLVPSPQVGSILLENPSLPKIPIHRCRGMVANALAQKCLPVPQKELFLGKLDCGAPNSRLRKLVLLGLQKAVQTPPTSFHSYQKRYRACPDIKYSAQRMSLCEALFSTWIPVSCGKCSQLHNRLLPERIWACKI